MKHILFNPAAIVCLSITESYGLKVPLNVMCVSVEISIVYAARLIISQVDDRTTPQ